MPHARGQKHFRAKLTDFEVKEVRRIRESRRWSYAQLAIKFNAGESTIRDIVTYRTRINVI